MPWDKQLFTVFNFDVLLWHVVVAAAVLLVLIVFIAVCAALSHAKKKVKRLERQQQALAEQKQVTATEQTDNPATETVSQQSDVDRLVTEQPVAMQETPQDVIDNAEDDNTEQIVEKDNEDMTTNTKSKSAGAKVPVKETEPQAKKPAKSEAPAKKQTAAPKAEPTAAKEAEQTKPVAAKATRAKTENKEDKPAAKTAATRETKTETAKPAKSETKKTTAKDAKTPAAKPQKVEVAHAAPKAEANAEPTEEKERTGPKVYHVSLRDDGKWQVKLSKGDKAIRLFDKQSEAIAYANDLAVHNGRVVIHRVDGKIRKKRY